MATGSSRPADRCGRVATRLPWRDGWQGAHPDGAVRVGKMTVARQLQDSLADAWLFYEVDRAQPRVPHRSEFATAHNDRRIRQVNLLAARTYLDAGFSLIIEIGLFDEDDRQCVGHALRGVDVTTVVLSCRPQTLDLHLEQRGDHDGGSWARSSTAKKPLAALTSRTLCLPTIAPQRRLPTRSREFSTSSFAHQG